MACGCIERGDLAGAEEQLQLARRVGKRGATPHGLMRTLGPFASSWSATYAQRRFATAEAPGSSGLSEPEKMALGAYIHHTLAGKGCGEFALPLLLAPGAHAREPRRRRAARSSQPRAPDGAIGGRAHHGAAGGLRGAGGGRREARELPTRTHPTPPNQPQPARACAPPPLLPPLPLHCQSPHLGARARGGAHSLARKGGAAGEAHGGGGGHGTPEAGGWRCLRVGGEGAGSRELGGGGG